MLKSRVSVSFRARPETCLIPTEHYAGTTTSFVTAMSSVYEEPCKSVAHEPYSSKESRVAAKSLNGPSGSSKCDTAKDATCTTSGHRAESLKTSIPSTPETSGTTASCLNEAGCTMHDPINNIEVSGYDDQEDSEKWTLSPTASYHSPSFKDIAFVSPTSGGYDKKKDGSGVLEIKVDVGLIGLVPRELRIRPNHNPCAVFALVDASSQAPRWHFIKEYAQLATFNEKIQLLLQPLMKKTKFRLRDFPDEELFRSTIPWKVDLRNDMLNAFFRSILWLNDVELYTTNAGLKAALEHALHELYSYDLVEPSPTRSFGMLGEEMCGFLLSRAQPRRNSPWDCYYYAINGSYLDVFSDIASGKLQNRISLHQARIEEFIVLYEATPDNARYAINVYERLASDQIKRHMLCAENEPTRQTWLRHLRGRVSNIAAGDISPGARSHIKIPPLPYVLPEASRSSPYLPNCGSSEDARRARARRGSVLFRSTTETSSAQSMHMPRERSIDTLSSGVTNSPLKVSLNDISGPVASHGKIDDARFMPRNITAAMEILDPNGSPEARITNSQPGSVTSSTLVGSFGSLIGYQKNGPRAVFGIMPSECKHQMRLENDDSVPTVVARCLEILHCESASSSQGVFRISGSQKLLDELESVFDSCGDYDLSNGDIDIYTTADLLKRYLRCLPGRLLEEYDELKSQTTLALHGPELVEALKSDVSRLNAINVAVVRALMELLDYLSIRESQNAMGARNLSVALSPSLKLPAPVLELYIRHQKEVFT